MADFSFGFTDGSFLLFNGQKHLRSVAEDLISNKKKKRTERIYQKRRRTLQNIKMCSLKKRIDDECRFLLECPAYDKVRKSLLKHVDAKEDDLNNQFIQLIASSNQNVIYDIARYLKRALRLEK